MMSGSLCPASSFSRTWFRRSFARSASDSAIVWFWHTRQRSSAEIAITRSSSSGSAAAGAASFAQAAPPSSNRNASTSALPMIGPRRKRHGLLTGRYGRSLRIPRGGCILRLAPAARREAIPAVACREQSAQRHQQGAAPDPVDERLVLHAHQPGRGAQLVAERRIEVTGESRVDRRFGHRFALREVAALCRIKGCYFFSRPGHVYGCACRRVIRSRHVGDAVEAENVAAHFHRVARFHANVLLALVSLDHRHSDDEHGHPDVRENYAMESARDARVLPPAARRRYHELHSVPNA